MNDNELNYLNAIFQVISLQKLDILSFNDVLKAEEHLAKKYNLEMTNLYRVHDLINNSFRATYMIRKEG